MQRFGVWVASAVLASVFAGCGGGGLEEGMPADATKANPQPPGFQDMMKNMGKDMTGQKAQRRAAAPKGEAPKGEAPKSETTKE